jgi:hypothetical protein
MLVMLTPLKIGFMLLSRDCIIQFFKKSMPGLQFIRSDRMSLLCPPRFEWPDNPFKENFLCASLVLLDGFMLTDKRYLSFIIWYRHLILSKSLQWPNRVKTPSLRLLRECRPLGVTVAGDVFSTFPSFRSLVPYPFWGDDQGRFFNQIVWYRIPIYYDWRIRRIQQYSFGVFGDY